MATYLASSLHLSGSLGEALNTTRRFVITNLGNPQGNYSSCYLTLEGNSKANPNLTTSVDLVGVFTNFIGGAVESSIIENPFGWSISLEGVPTSEFEFTPLSPVPQDGYYIRGEGNFDLAII